MRPRAQGFTLIEMLVALALMGLASSLVLLTVQSAGLVAKRERTVSTGLGTVIAAQRVLRRTIERLQPISRVDSVLAIVELRGTEEALAFIAPAPDHTAPDALRRFRLARTATGTLMLYSASLRQREIDHSGVSLVGWTATPLLSGVTALSIRYFGVPESGGGAVWLDEWWDRSQPPRLVRIRIDFAPGDRRLWPDLIIRPRATTNSTCSVEGPSNRCGDVS